MKNFEETVVFIFDIDGVVLDTPHEQAWRNASIDWALVDEEFDFTQFYESNVAGKPGIAGAKHILQNLCISGGQPFYAKNKVTNDKQKLRWAEKFRVTKQQHLDQQLDARNFRVFEDVVRIIMQSKQAGLKVAAISSSENARKVLESIPTDKLRKIFNIPLLDSVTTNTLAGIFDATALGAVSYWPGVQVDKSYHYAMTYGKLLSRIGDDEIPRVVVFEDSASSILEAKKLGFYCVGIARNPNSREVVSSRNSLLTAGADLAFTEDELAAVDYLVLRSLLLKIIDHDEK